MKETRGNGYSKAEQLRLREASDRLCREYGLSVIEKLRKAPSRPVWLDEKNGKPTRYNVYRADVREAMEFSRTPYYMEDYLRRKGYVSSLEHTSWRCQYHVVFAPKYRRMEISEKIKEDIGIILRKLCQQVDTVGRNKKAIKAYIEPVGGGQNIRPN